MRTCLLPVLLLAVSGLAGAGEPHLVPCAGKPCEVVPCTTCKPAEPVTCLPVAKTETKTRTCYSCRCKTICLPYKPRCDGCGECGRPREVRLLVKRFVKEEVPEHACEPAATPCVPCPAVKCP